MTSPEESWFAVVDVETTGLSPLQYDRVVEVAILTVDSSSEIREEFVTLVNPNRTVGPTDLHGIGPQDVMQAPTFDQIAGEVLQRLAGKVVVAHNADFDTLFINSECELLGITLPPYPKLCTMKLCCQLNPELVSRTLSSCCRHYQLPVSHGHTALEDARACARLLAVCLHQAAAKGLSLGELIEGELIFSSQWPSHPVSAKPLRRGESRH